MFDLTRKESTLGLDTIVTEFKNKCPELAQGNLVLIGNKCDSELRDIPREEGEFLAK